MSFFFSVFLLCCFSFTLFFRIEVEGVDSGKGVTVHYSLGEYCPGSSGTSSTINVLCGDDEAVTDVVISRDGCSLTITIKSQAGCGTAEKYDGSDGGETAAIVILVLFVIYLAPHLSSICVCITCVFCAFVQYSCWCRPLRCHRYDR